MPRQIALIFRILAVVLLIVAVAAALLGWLCWRDLRWCLAERPIDTTIGLSQAQELECPFEIKYPYGYGFDVELSFPNPLPPALERENALADLTMDLAVYASNGSGPLSRSQFQGEGHVLTETESAHSVIIMRIRRRLPQGRYLLQLKILQGLPALSDINPRLAMAYLIDFEMLGPFIPAGWSIVAFVGAGLCAWLGFGGPKKRSNSDEKSIP